MARIALFLFLLFAALLLLRAMRIFLERWAKGAAGAARRPLVDGEMVRDPICGTWIDRRLAIAGRRGDEWHPVCSEECRKRLEARA